MSKLNLGSSIDNWNQAQSDEVPCNTLAKIVVKQLNSFDKCLKDEEFEGILQGFKQLSESTDNDQDRFNELYEQFTKWMFWL